MTVVAQDNKAGIPGIVGHMTPITVDHAEGSWVWGTDGSKWLDFCVGIAVANTGHCHPKVVKAAQEQLGKIIHSQMNMYYHQPMLDLTASLCELVPGKMEQVLYANSGAEAVENAVKLAKRHLAPAGRDRLPQRLPRSHPSGHGAHRFGDPLPWPHGAAGGEHLSRALLRPVSTRRLASMRPTTPSRMCAVCCAPRSTATTSPPSSSSRSRARAASSCPSRASSRSCARSPTRSAPT